MDDLQQDNTKKNVACSQEEPKPDYYLENGFLVFTETYHLKRGHCCKNACRHCPYGFKKRK